MTHASSSDSQNDDVNNLPAQSLLPGTHGAPGANHPNPGHMLGFNQMLDAHGIAPSSVRLLRHAPVLETGAHLIDLWQSDRRGFEHYQALQLHSKRSHFASAYWASFIGTSDGRTLFAGVYQVDGTEQVLETCISPLTGEQLESGIIDRYAIERVLAFDQYAGRLMIDWGGGSSGKRAWVQRAERQNKPITAFLEHAFERPFPGFIAYREKLGDINAQPAQWSQRLAQARGVYLLACPDAGWLYVGSATGQGGFWQRWQDYVSTGHGGNLGLKDRDMGNVHVTILQVAGSGDSTDDIMAMEELWKSKLQSRAFGSNQN